jgi:shikimate kinase
VRGLGTASGAVTIVNALPTGIGCALAVNLPVRAEIELRAVEGIHSHRIQFERACDTQLVREALAAGLARFTPGATFSGEVRIDSEVPTSKGLKSSSAVAGALLRALSSALRQSRSTEELGRLAADVAQEIGLSATGAYDDCIAALRGGVVITDNTHRVILRSPSFPSGLQTILWIPPESHPPSPLLRERFRKESEAGRAAVDAAREGRWSDAMTLNTELVERVMGYDYRGLRGELLEQGAVMCGVSGMGPALAALAPAAKVEAVAARLPSTRGEIRRVELRPGDEGGGASP